MPFPETPPTSAMGLDNLFGQDFGNGLGGGMSPLLSSLYAMESQPAPEPEPVRVPPPDYTPAQIKEIEESAKLWAKRSAEYIRAKEQRFLEAEALYNGWMDLKEWKNGTYERNKEKLPAFSSDTQSPGAWRSDYVQPIANLLDFYADKIVSAILSGPDWVTLISTVREVDVNILGGTHTIREALTHLFLEKLDEACFGTELRVCARNMLQFGTTVALSYWHTDTVPAWYLRPGEDKPEEGDPEVVAEYPVVQEIPIMDALVDPDATGSNCQKWRAIGFRRNMTKNEILEAFRTGEMDRNEDKIREMPGDRNSDSTQRTQLGIDPDKTIPTTDSNLEMLTVWEIHGKQKLKDRDVECVTTLVTGVDTDDPGDGILTSVYPGTFLDRGKRPFAVSHFIEDSAPLGRSLIDRIRKLVFENSTLMAQFADHTRMNLSQLFWGKPHIMEQIADEGGAFWPGMALSGRTDQDFGWKSPPPIPMQPVLQLKQILDAEIERASVTSVAQGVDTPGEMTATQANALAAHSQTPLATTASLFAKYFVSPLLTQALMWLQMATVNDAYIEIPGAGNDRVPVDITTEEIRSGQWRCITTVSDTGQNRLAVAASIERILPVLVNPDLIARLEAEGTDISVSDFIYRLADALSIDGSDRLIRRFSDRETQLLMQNQELQAIVQELEMQLSEIMGQSNQQNSPGESAQPASPALIEQGGPVTGGYTDTDLMAQLQQEGAQYGVPGQGPVQ